MHAEMSSSSTLQIRWFPFVSVSFPCYFECDISFFLTRRQPEVHLRLPNRQGALYRVLDSHSSFFVPSNSFRKMQNLLSCALGALQDLTTTRSSALSREFLERSVAQGVGEWSP